VLPTAPWTQVRTYVERYAGPVLSQLPALAAACPRLWLVSSHEGQIDGPATARANDARFLALGSGLEAAYRHHASVSFGYASPVRVELLSR
jgi:hypothetical protein